eukprot:5806320-Lingulodinium_polyedra.AAC.1
MARTPQGRRERGPRGGRLRRRPQTLPAAYALRPPEGGRGAAGQARRWRGVALNQLQARRSPGARA